MRYVTGFVIAAVYFLLVCGLLVSREFAARLMAFEKIEISLIVLTFPWSIFTFIYAAPVNDAPGSGQLAAIVIYLSGAFVNALLIYLVYYLLALAISKFRKSKAP